MNHNEFMAICSSLGHPKRGWQKQAVEKAAELGYNINQSTISQICNDPNKTISPRTAQTMRALADAVASGDFAPGVQTGPSVNPEAAQAVFKDPDDDLSDEEIIKDIGDRFQTFDECLEAVICGKRHSVLVSGPPGCGKSHSVAKYEKKVKEEGDTIFEPVTGDISPPELFMLLYRIRENGVAVFDDCDGVFADETKLNLLKGALDTKPPGAPRYISWLKMTRGMVDARGDEIEKTFDFQGRIVFMTNIDFDREIERGTKLAPHLRALMDRSGYMSLGLHSKRRRLLRVVQVCQDSNIMEINGIKSDADKQEILGFVRDNQDRWRNLNLRLVVNLCGYRLDFPSKWQKHAEQLLMRPRR